MGSWKKGKLAIAALCTMAILLGGCSGGGGDKVSDVSNVLIHFDKQDRARMVRFMDRAEQGKFDYVLAVSSTFEGGKIIYDLTSDQQDRQIHLTVDTSRDAYAGMTRGKSEYACGEIGWTDKFGNDQVMVTQCRSGDSAADDQILFSFSK